MNHTNLNYKYLENKALKNPPYRGTTNRFPLLGRKSLSYYFLRVQEGDQVVFDICYGSRWHQKSVSSVEAAKYENKDVSVHPDGHGGLFVYEKVHNEMLRVRPDDTIQFVTAGTLGQGERYFLSKFFTGNFSNNSRLGGVIYRSQSKLLPIYRGLRIRPDMTPIDDVRVTVRSVDRKKSRELTKRYETFFKVSEVMLKTISTPDAWSQLVVDVAQQNDTVIKSSSKRYNDYVSKEVKDRFVSLMDDAPLDAFVLAALYHDTRFVRELVDRGGKYPSWAHTNLRFLPEQVFETTKRRMLKDLYKASPEIFTSQTHPLGTPYKSTDWGVLITENGNRVTPYGYSSR